MRFYLDVVSACGAPRSMDALATEPGEAPFEFLFLGDRCEQW